MHIRRARLLMQQRGLGLVGTRLAVHTQAPTANHSLRTSHRTRSRHRASPLSRVAVWSTSSLHRAAHGHSLSRCMLLRNSANKRSLATPLCSRSHLPLASNPIEAPARVDECKDGASQTSRQDMREHMPGTNFCLQQVVSVHRPHLLAPAAVAGHRLLWLAPISLIFCCLLPWPQLGRSDLICGCR